MGHSELECVHQVSRNADGKLPYDVELRAPEERKKHIQTFAGAAADSFGSSSPLASKPPRGQHSRLGDSRSSVEDDSWVSSSDKVGDTEDQEVQSPLKQKTGPLQAGGSAEERNKEGMVLANSCLGKRMMGCCQDEGSKNQKVQVPLRKP